MATYHEDRSITEGTLDLGNGRRLGYAEWGQADAPPIVYCHGSPGNRLELEIARRVVEHRGVRARVIAFDRPGFGLSTFRKIRFRDWPDDVVSATRMLGIERFAVLGASGGAPFALACGHLLPSLVTRIGIVVGAGPIEATGMDDSTAVRLPSRNPVIRRCQYELIARSFRSGREDRVVTQSIRSMGEADRRAMERTDVREWFASLFREAVAQGGRASAHEAGLMLDSWGFDISEIHAPTFLWYGGQDRHVPASVGQWLSDRIPGARLVVWPQHGHFTWAMSDEVADVVEALAADDPRTPR